MKVFLNTEKKIVDLVNYVGKHPDINFDLVKGKTCVDAGSILGVHAIDLSNPVELNIHAERFVDTSVIEKEINQLLAD